MQKDTFVKAYNMVLDACNLTDNALQVRFDLETLFEDDGTDDFADHDVCSAFETSLESLNTAKAVFKKFGPKFIEGLSLEEAVYKTVIAMTTSGRLGDWSRHCAVMVLVAAGHPILDVVSFFAEKFGDDPVWLANIVLDESPLTLREDIESVLNHPKSEKFNSEFRDLVESVRGSDSHYGFMVS